MWTRLSEPPRARVLPSGETASARTWRGRRELADLLPAVVPEPDGLVESARDDPGAVGQGGDRLDLIGVAGKGRLETAGRDVPDGDDLVAARGQRAWPSGLNRSDWMMSLWPPSEMISRPESTS